MMHRRIRSYTLAAATAALLAAPLAAASTYDARLVNDDPRQGRKIENLQLKVDRLSTPDELAALANGGAKSAAEIGSARLDRTTSRAVIAAVETADGAGKKLVVVFEKPLNWFDASRNPSAREYPHGVVELELDGDGVGQGQLLAGAKVRFDKSGIVIEAAAGEPMRVIQVSNDGS